MELTRKCFVGVETRWFKVWWDGDGGFKTGHDGPSCFGGVVGQESEEGCGGVMVGHESSVLGSVSFSFSSVFQWPLMQGEVGK